VLAEAMQSYHEHIRRNAVHRHIGKRARQVGSKGENQLDNVTENLQNAKCPSSPYYLAANYIYKQYKKGKAAPFIPRQRLAGVRDALSPDKPSYAPPGTAAALLLNPRHFDSFPAIYVHPRH
jgi:hypothetical protein